MTLDFMSFYLGFVHATGLGWANVYEGELVGCLVDTDLICAKLIRAEISRFSMRQWRSVYESLT